MTIFEEIVKHLADEGFDVYSPQTKIGDCISSYIVVKFAGSNQHIFASTDVDLYDVMCYVPKNKYSELEKMLLNVKASMKKMYPKIIPYGNQTPSFYDSAIKAFMVSIKYKNYKKM